MQLQSNLSPTEETLRPNCVFCRREQIASSILKETQHFRIIIDYAPLIEGHLLIIPTTHYACYGDTPQELDQELYALKEEVSQFFQQTYAATPTYWEHGVFRQTVFHAHLHCLPFGHISYTPEHFKHQREVKSQEDIRQWYQHQGQYYYLEDQGHGYVFAPILEEYMYIAQNVLRAQVILRTQQTQWRSAQQRIEEGGPWIAAVRAKWQAFQEGKESNEKGEP